MKSDSYKAKWFVVIFCATILFAGCNKEPPFVDSKEAVLRLPTSTQNIWARSLRDEDFASLSHLQELSDIDFYAGWKDPDAPVRFSDAGLATLANLDLPRLNTVVFGRCTNVTDASLIYIAKLKNVTGLALVACPRITDAGLQTLAVMPSLTELSLRGCTNITDKGLEYLATKSNWQRIEFGGCPRVTFEAVTNLQQHFPNAKIKKDDQEWSYEQ
jgi:hypothetical protein